MREAGANVVSSSQELFDVSAAFARNKDGRLGGRRAAIFSLAGGPGVVAADHCEEFGIELPQLEEQLQGLRAIVPPYAALGNPVEVTGQTKREHLGTCAQAIVDQPNIDAMVGIAIGLDFKEFANSLIAANEKKPVVACIVAEQSETMLADAGIVNYPSVDRAVRALGHLMDRATHIPPEAPGAAAVPKPLASGVLTEAQSKAYLGQYGLPVTSEQEVADVASAIDVANRIGYPVALKVSSAAIAHKSDVGGVMLNLRDKAALQAAADAMARKFPGEKMLVQTMVAPGLELIVGARRTPDMGTIVMVGIGGVFAEVLDDAVFCRAPTTTSGAERALGRLRSQRLLDGYRGAPAIDGAAVARIMEQLSQVVAANPEIVEVDLNPVIAGAKGAIVVDALIRTEATKSAEDHK